MTGEWSLTGPVSGLVSGCIQRVDETLLRMRALSHALEDVATGLVKLRDDDETAAHALISSIALELANLDVVRAQLALLRITLTGRKP